jgi:hypothetical protein
MNQETDRRYRGIVSMPIGLVMLLDLGLPSGGNGKIHILAIAVSIGNYAQQTPFGIDQGTAVGHRRNRRRKLNKTDNQLWANTRPPFRNADN